MPRRNARRGRLSIAPPLGLRPSAPSTPASAWSVCGQLGMTTTLQRSPRLGGRDRVHLRPSCERDAPAGMGSRQSVGGTRCATRECEPRLARSATRGLTRGNVRRRGEARCSYSGGGKRPRSSRARPRGRGGPSSDKSRSRELSRQASSRRRGRGRDVHDTETSTTSGPRSAGQRRVVGSRRH